MKVKATFTFKGITLENKEVVVRDFREIWDYLVNFSSLISQEEFTYGWYREPQSKVLGILIFNKFTQKQVGELRFEVIEI